MKEIENNFHRELMQNYLLAKKMGYNATYFIQMISEIGGYQTAIKLINTPNPSEGFTKLWQMKRLDISLEATCLKEDYLELFTEEEREKCRTRLNEYDYVV